MGNLPWIYNQQEQKVNTGGLTPKSDARHEQRKHVSWACTLKAVRQQETLPGECTGGWRTAEKSVIKGEHVALRCYCSPFKFYPMLNKF